MSSQLFTIPSEVGWLSSSSDRYFEASFPIIISCLRNDLPSTARLRPKTSRNATWGVPPNLRRKLWGSCLLRTPSSCILFLDHTLSPSHSSTNYNKIRQGNGGLWWVREKWECFSIYEECRFMDEAGIIAKWLGDISK